MKNYINSFFSIIESRNRTILTLSILLVLVSGTFYSLYLGNNLRFWDEHEYYKIADNLIQKNIYSLDGINKTAYRPPGYSWFLSILISLGSSITMLRIANFTALACSIYIIYLITKKMHSKLASSIACLLVLFYPVLFYLAGILAAQTVGTTLFLLILLLVFNNESSPYTKYAAVGFLFGCLILMVPSFLFSLLVVTVWLVFDIPTQKIRKAALTFTVALLIIFSWSIRNYYVFDTFVFISTHTGMVLLDGNSEGTTPNSGSMTDTTKYTDKMPKGLNEVEKDKYLKTKAVEFMLNNKARTIKMYFLKALNYFNYTNEIRGEISSYTKRFKDSIMLITYGSFLLLFIARLFHIKKFRPSSFEVLLISLYLSTPFFIAIFLTRIRYRLPFDLILISMVAAYISNLLGSMHERKESGGPEN